MKTPREILRQMAEFERFAKQLDDPNWPSPQEHADAKHALAQDRAKRQDELPLRNP